METLISVAQVRIAAQHPLLWAYLNQGEHISKHTGTISAQSTQVGPAWALITCFVTDLGYCM